MRKNGAMEWHELLGDRVASFGHRNWIVIADSAYPVQTSPGIETAVSGAEQLEAVRAALEHIAAAGHVVPTVYIDRELRFVAEADAPGVSPYRERLEALLGPWGAKELPHDQIIARLDEAGRAFGVLILKTTLKIPYTSVFLQLECGYWNPEAEGRLRAAMG
jgi:hypothetical protein